MADPFEAARQDLEPLISKIESLLTQALGLDDELAGRVKTVAGLARTAVTKLIEAQAAAAVAKVVDLVIERELSSPTVTATSMKNAVCNAAKLAADAAPGLTIAGTAAAAGVPPAVAGTIVGSDLGGRVGTTAGAVLGTLPPVVAAAYVGPALSIVGGAVAGAVAGGILGGTTHGLAGAATGAAFAAAFLAPAVRDGANALAEGVCQAAEDSMQNEIKRRPLPKRSPHAIDLDSLYPKVMRDGWLALVKPDREELFRIVDVGEASRAEYALTTKTTRVTLAGRRLKKFKHDVRATTVFAQSERLTLAEEPIPDPVPAADRIELDQKVGGLLPGRFLAVTGNLAAAVGETPAGTLMSEVVRLVEMSNTNRERTTLVFDPPLEASYERASVTIAANVAPATRGETRREILGSGDASKAHQRFVLKETPLTYVSAATETGSSSTLEIRVNDILWKEAPTLFDRGPHERVYVTRATEDGKIAVQFGDGRSGARLPTGVENVRAQYRVGTGLDGHLAAGQLRLLMSRIAGVRAATNPLPTSGAEAPEDIGDAKRNAPTTVLTLGRAVSLRDYEDFARTFGGIAKAHATWVWTAGVRGIFITVAGSDGAPVPETQANLLAALRAFGDPHVPIEIATFSLVQFTLSARVTIDRAYLTDLVRDQIQRSLSAAFGFEARDLGQAVSLSEVIAVIQSVGGVIAVEIDRLDRTDMAAGGRYDRLRASTPAPGAGDEVAAAELLLLDPAALGQVEVTS